LKKSKSQKILVYRGGTQIDAQKILGKWGGTQFGTFLKILEKAKMLFSQDIFYQFYDF
jgi:hypothetical protein